MGFYIRIKYFYQDGNIKIFTHKIEEISFVSEKYL